MSTARGTKKLTLIEGLNKKNNKFRYERLISLCTSCLKKITDSNAVYPKKTIVCSV